jgi:hypothetical protein
MMNPFVANVKALNPLMSKSYSTNVTDEEKERRRRQELRAYERRKKSDDPTEILAGQVVSHAERQAWKKYQAQMTWTQKIVCQTIYSMIGVRNSFIHGNTRRALTVMAVYAAGAEFLHDFFHEYHMIHKILGLVGTEHAVGFIALSHLSEHMKEYLLESEKPKYHAKERQRKELLRIFAGTNQPHWPRHIKWYNEYWDKHRKDLGCFVAFAEEEVRAAQEKK